MLTRRRFLSSGVVAIAGVLSTRLLASALTEPAVVHGVTTWGVGGNHTWLNNGPTHKSKRPNRPQRSLTFDNDYRPTESFFAIRDCFDARKPERA
jgi:GH35 family endo-1,4-beta-xylanase